MAAELGLFIVGCVIIIGLISHFIFKKTGIPDSILLILSGVAITALGLSQGFDKSSKEITFLITLSLVYVVFYGALPIRLKALFSTMKYSMFSALLNFIAITAIIWPIAYLLKFDPVLAFCLGALFCSIDGSVINSLLEVIKLGKRAEAQIQTESAILDVITIIAITSVLNFSQITAAEVAQTLAGYLLLSMILGIIISMIWAFALRHISNFVSIPISTMAVLAILYACAEFLGANGVITVFFFSIMLGNVAVWSKMFYKEQKDSIAALSTQTREVFKDMSLFFRIFLFVYLGVIIDFSNWSYLLIGLGFFVIAYVLRSALSKLFANKEVTRKEHNLMEAMCAKGLTPIALLGIISTNTIFTNIVVGGIFSSVIVTSVSILLIEKNKYTDIIDLFVRPGKKPGAKGKTKAEKKPESGQKEQ
jgi:NhaP-type Na+/H+ or K+/H+ antiporter